MLLFPPSPHDWLPQDHPAHFLNEVVELFNLWAIYDSYGGLRGQPPYNPVMMVKVWIYGLSKGIHSSRKLERALYEDVGLRYLSGNQQPDYWTLPHAAQTQNQTRSGALQAPANLGGTGIWLCQRAVGSTPVPTPWCR